MTCFYLVFISPDGAASLCADGEYTNINAAAEAMVSRNAQAKFEERINRDDTGRYELRLSLDGVERTAPH